jgi:hypothetical protein
MVCQLDGMTPELRGINYRSNPEVFTLGAPITFKQDFLQNARFNMDAPEVWNINMVFTGTVGAITGGALGRDAAKLFDLVRFKDASDVLNCSGASMRVLEQMDFGYRQVDPADIASGLTNTAYRYVLRWAVAPPSRALRPRDFAMPIQNFLEGGEFTIQTAAAVPTGWAAIQSDWRLQLVYDVRDGRKKELKSRRRIKEEALTQQEFDYQINGFCRAAIITSKLTTTGYTDLTSYTNVNSRTLNFPSSYKVAELIDEYRREAEVSLGTNDEFVRATTAAIPFLMPRNENKTGTSVDMKSLHIDLLAAAPAGGRLVTDVIVDRDPMQSTLVLGYQSPGDTAAAVKAHGVVVGDADNYDATGFNGVLGRKLPIRIKPSGK